MSFGMMERKERFWSPNGHRTKILDFLKETGKKLTRKQISEKLELAYCSVCGRVNELIYEGALSEGRTDTEKFKVVYYNEEYQE